MNAIQKFCEERKITKTIQDAFEAYCRSAYAERFDLLGSGDTVKSIINKLTIKQVEDAWRSFVLDFKKSLS